MNTQTTRFYIGFTTLEEFLKTFSGAEIYLSATTKSQTGKFGIRLTNWFVTIAGIENEKCFYWQTQTGVSQSVGGNPMDDEREKSRTRTSAYLDLLKLELKNNPVRIIEAMVSFPADLEILHGSTDLIGYDKKSDSYFKTEV